MDGRLRRAGVALASCGAVLLGAGAARAAVPVTGGGGGLAARSDVQAATPLPRRAVLTDALAPATPLQVTIALQPRPGLAAYAAAVSDPGSPSYRHYLSVGQFRARFGARSSAAAAVREALRRSGLRVGPLAVNGLALSASGPASSVEDVFHTRLRHVALPGGRRAFADVVAPTLPTGVAAAVQGVVGLESLPLVRPEGLVHARSRPHVAMQAAATGAGPATCTNAQGHGNTAQDIGSAYGMSGLWQAGDVGTGATIALYELEPFSASDVSAYDSCYGISTRPNVIKVGMGAGTGSGQGEAALDIEDVSGLAPGATIDVYEGANNSSGPYQVYARIVSDDAAQVVSTSWGACEADVGSAYAQEENALFQEAATQGQTVYAAAGDDGSDDCAHAAHDPNAGTQAVDDPASQPDVTGVGGTSLPSWVTPQDEPVWNDTEGAGGGGVSSLWAPPSYQSALGGGAREVPDVSADADPETGYAIFFDGTWTTYGGTSAAAPTWAALTALALRSRACAAHTHGFGLVNDALYGLSSDFYDVTSGSNGFDGVGGYSAAPGYDMASGLGAPDGATLAPALCGSSAGQAVDDPVATTSSTSSTTATTATAPTPAPTPTPPPTTTAAPPATTPSAPTTTASPVTTTTAAGGSPDRHPAPSAIAFSVPARIDDAIAQRVHLVLRAHDRAGRRLTYVADGLPPGLRLDRDTGTVTGRPRHAGTYVVSVDAVDAAGNARSVVIRWRVVGAGPSERRSRHQENRSR